MSKSSRAIFFTGGSVLARGPFASLTQGADLTLNQEHTISVVERSGPVDSKIEVRDGGSERKFRSTSALYISKNGLPKPALAASFIYCLAGGPLLLREDDGLPPHFEINSSWASRPTAAP